MDTKEYRQRWEAVLARDRSFDGLFVYGVRSTGVYCRPSCGARKPREEKVTFFASAQDARSAGFRACRRCMPDEPVNRDPQKEMVRRLSRFIEDYDSADRPLTLAVMSDYMKRSPSHLQRTFTRIMGVSPRRYAEISRLERFKAMLRDGRGVTPALYEAGYGSSSRLYEGANRRLGMTPGAYKKGGKGMKIRYIVVGCPLGRLLTAGTDKGISAVSLGASDEVLERALYDEYPSAQIVRDRAGLEGYVEALLKYLEGRGEVLDIPRDVRATAFQARVYEALTAIPYGVIRTYGQVAEAMGDPKAARAVGGACAVNPTALVVPCHRVIGADGGIGGYRWGVERKRALLTLEQERNRDESFEDGAGI
ncbi:MAG: methylated-DNA--[protein]-cysteine S-methyltransferase [Deltaproteobacteria bacterium]|nr:methylated-DNA--[protein]-cysteine S-methyltransferase [Candidatus Zymogenaceae bacterium]